MSADTLPPEVEALMVDELNDFERHRHVVKMAESLAHRVVRALLAARTGAPLADALAAEYARGVVDGRVDLMERADAAREQGRQEVMARLEAQLALEHDVVLDLERQLGSAYDREGALQAALRLAKGAP